MEAVYVMYIVGVNVTCNNVMLFVCIYRTSVLREIEMEDKRRKWYFDQLEDLQKKLESLPVSDTVSF